jgi:hypothetical protein
VAFAEAPHGGVARESPERGGVHGEQGGATTDACSGVRGFDARMAATDDEDVE